ncbi:MAG: sialate O-acetylesterase [Pedobacter sp.]|nr:MAG: sialate O-acetylesterase [Pedobacter sp.]
MRNISLIFAFLLINLISSAQIKLPKLISDGMILQRNAEVKIWGFAAPNENIKLEFNRKTYTAKANSNGDWEIKLPAQKAGGPYQMVFTASNKIVLKDVLFGDVWLCSGQSNMELPMGRLVDKYPDVISNANNTQIRQFLVPDEYDFKNPRKDFSTGSWLNASPKNVLDFSAVAYFFALDIYKNEHVPIGIINAALGGSPAQAWISESAIQKFTTYKDEVLKFKNDSLIKAIDAADQSASNAWYKKLNTIDEGLNNNWKGNVDESGWLEMNVPGYWADGSLGKVNGVIWFKKEIEVPASMVGKSVKLLLGRIVDADSVFINGNFVGTTSYQYPPRRYLFNEGILEKGKNTITVRIVNNSGNGGFVMDKEYLLVSGKDTINLQGKWKYKLGAKMEQSPSQTFVRWKTTGLYNAMINPLTNYAIKGALWYQGEANTNKPEEYKSLMQTLITDWRAQWKQNFPFLYVQLPSFMDELKQPSESGWASLRQQQLDLLTMPNTRMAVTIDLGEWNDIHPLNKKDVGERLALQARSLVYGEKKMVSSGPIFKSLIKDKNQVVINFSDAGSGLMAKGNQPLKYFEVAGADKKFVWAKAEIKNGKVVVWSDHVVNPMYVRYAWANNPAAANLYNKEGLPASPFEAQVGQ